MHYPRGKDQGSYKRLLMEGQLCLQKTDAELQSFNIQESRVSLSVLDVLCLTTITLTVAS